MSIAILPIVFLFFLLVTAVPVIMGIFVYRDAKARGMDALLWTLVAVFAPGFVGLIIYLIMRRDHMKLSCPVCGSEVRQTFVSCPACGQKLAASCVNCGAALSPEWKLCPQCGTPITQTSDFAPPVVSKPDNKGFLIAILAIMAVPVALIIVAASLYAFSGVKSSDENDSTMRLIDDMIYETGAEPVCVTSSDACKLTDAQREWIMQKQTGKKGIYSTTFSKPASGEITTDQYSCSYNIVYDYTVIVVNAKKGRSYIVGRFDYQTSQFIPYTVNISLSETSPDDNEAIQYENVFVIRTISSYNAKWNYSDGRKPEMAENKPAYTSNVITVTTENGENYVIPSQYDKEYYTPFNN